MKIYFFFENKETGKEIKEDLDEFLVQNVTICESFSGEFLRELYPRDSPSRRNLNKTTL